MKRHPQMSAGFTLIELLLVLGIMALVLATVVGSRPNDAATRVAVAARAVAATVQLARAQAMSSNAETVFLVDAQRREFGLYSAMHPLPRGIIVAMTVAATERVRDSGGLRFYPDGQSSGGEIVLSLNGRVSRIAVNWLTGEPQLSP